MMQQWQALKPHEQRFVFIGGILALVLVIYFALWQPFSRQVDRMKQEVTEQQEMVDWIAQHKEE